MTANHKRIRANPTKRNKALAFVPTKERKITPKESAKLQDTFLERMLEFDTNIAECTALGIPENTLYGWVCNPEKSTPEFKKQYALLRKSRLEKKKDKIENFLGDVADGSTATGKDQRINMPNVTAGIFMLKSLDKETYGEGIHKEVERQKIKIIEVNKINGTVTTTEEHTIETRDIKSLPEGEIDGSGSAE